MIDYVESFKLTKEAMREMNEDEQFNVQNGNKHDNGKSRVDLLDSDFLMAVGECLKYGAEKPGYGSHNWRGGLAYSRVIGAILRHILAINRGEDIDPESRFPHTAHLGCEVQFLHWLMKYKPELDDRYKYESK